MAAKICSICNLRPIPSLKVRDDAGMSRDMDYCVPCYDEAGWENTHSDQAHEYFAETFASAPVACSEEGCSRLEAHKGRHGSATKAETKIVDAYLAEFQPDQVEAIQAEMENCWLCRPELNQAKREYVQRAGISRKGQVIHAKGDVTEKSRVLVEAIEAAGGTAKVTKSRGEIKLSGECPRGLIEVRWDARGRYQYGPSVFYPAGSVKINKIRNVSEALRLISGV
jgi:hypothetical protein